MFLSTTAQISSVTIAAGGSSAGFTYEDTTAGTPTLTAAGGGLASATQQETVNPATAAKLVFITPAQTSPPAGPSRPPCSWMTRTATRPSQAPAG